MRYLSYINFEPPRKTRETILDERNYKFRTIVLGKNKHQHKIGIKCTKRGCVHPKSEKGFTVHWKKFFTELPPASKYGDSYGLARAYFDNPDKLAGEFGPLRLGCSEI
jgi:hypothetical protein